MNFFATGLEAMMGKRHPEDPTLEVLHEGDRIILRRVVDAAKFRELADKVLANMPKLKARQGESITREIAEDRARGYR